MLRASALIRIIAAARMEAVLIMATKTSKYLTPTFTHSFFAFSSSPPYFHLFELDLILEKSTTPCTGASTGNLCDDDASDHCSGTDDTCVDAVQPS